MISIYVDHETLKIAQQVYKVKVEKQNPVVNRLEKTKKEEHPDFREQRERRDAEERNEKKKQLREQKEKEKVEEKKKKEEAELR